jgi:hypothetical protein
MLNDPEITECLDGVARPLHDNVGQGKPLGVVEVAEIFRVSDRTVYGRINGTTTGDMRLDELLQFAKRYRKAFPAMTDAMIDAVCRGFGGHFVRDLNDDVAFLDSNGDGHADHRDIPAHAAEAAKVMVSETLEGDGTPTAARRETNRRRCLEVRRRARAMERLVR